MNKISIIEKSKIIKIDKDPVVLVPLKIWKKMEDYIENQEALSSKKYLQKIKQARKDILKGKLIYPFR
ncbi:MAG: hypothetical protein AAB491_00735 [Patescibacteria group bacterium]